MPVSADHLRRLAALGLPSEAMGEVLSILAEVEEGTGANSPGAARTRRWRERQASRGTSQETSQVTSPNVTTVTSEASQSVTHAGARAEPTKLTLPVPIQENKKEKKQTEAGNGASAPVSVLETVLDPDRASAVVEHRSRMGKGKALTENSARLLAARLAACPDPNAAADEMIVRGWMSVKPDWLQERSTGPPGRPMNGHGERSLADILHASRAAIAEAEKQDQAIELKLISH